MTRPVLLSYRTLGIGDLLTAVPALRALRQAFPHHEHVLVAPAPLAPLIPALDAVDRHLPVAELAPLPPFARTPDVAVNLHGRGPQSHQVLLAADPRRLLAYHHPSAWPDDAAPRWARDEHEVHRWCRLLATHGIPADPTDLRVVPPPGPVIAAGATLIHPGAKAPARRWPVDRFAAVARDQRRRGHRVLITGSPDERGSASHVAELAGLPRQAVLAGDWSLTELLGAIAVAGRVVCGDTGVAHLATAVGTASVVLFGPTSPDTWGPPPESRARHRALWKGRRGDPLGRVPDPGLLEITADDVVAELAALDEAAILSETSLTTSR